MVLQNLSGVKNNSTWPWSASGTLASHRRTGGVTNFHNGSSGVDPRSLPPKGPKPRDIYVPDLHIDSIKLKTRDFR